MRWTKQSFVTAVGLALLATLAVAGPSLAQQPAGKSGTGGAAGNSPQTDEPVGGGASGSSMDAAPPMSRGMGAPEPEPEPDMAAPPPDENKQDEAVPAPDTKDK
jgi:hypothetical protein